MIETSQTIVEIAKALLAFQSKVESVKMDGDNPFFKSKYATLTSIIDTIRKPMKESQLSFSQFPCGDNELVTILMHVSGEYIRAKTKINPKDNSPQAQGSGITYMRRYALQSILGLATEEDDDGNSASGNQTKTQTTPKTDVAKRANELITNATSLQNLDVLAEKIQKSTQFTKAQKEALSKKVQEKKNELDKK